jgi:uncharacterized protein
VRRAACPAAPGYAEASALVLSAPLSFWGGIEVETGRIIDRAHPERGISVTGRILVLPGGRGSSSSSSVLAESIRRGTGPVGIVLEVPDPILTVGAIVARSLYHIQVPLVVCTISDIASGDRLVISASDTGDAFVEWTNR